MGKSNKKKQKSKGKKTNNTSTSTSNSVTSKTEDDLSIEENKYPFVSVYTPTFNRRPFISGMIKCFDHQDYPFS